MKARYADLAVARERVGQLDVRPGGVEVQTDTYFRAPTGRLKLRETDGRPPVLIWYDRPDRAEARASTYRLVPVPDAAEIKALLTAALGLRGEVCKRREIYFWHNIRIHLDEVAGLGTLVEFEAVLGSGDDEATAGVRLEHLCQLFGIAPSDHLGPSNADLLGL
jgi:predicted adenylyl cyclase CyaB